MKTKILIPLILVIILSGCVSNTGDVTEYSAPEAQVDDKVLNGTDYNNKTVLNYTGYKYNTTREISYNKTLNVSVTELNVEVNSYFTVYDRQNNGTLVPKSTYGVLSTPSVSPSGVELNPAVVEPADTVVEELNGNLSGISLKLQDKINETNITTERYGNTTVETYNSSIVIEDADIRVNSKIMSSVIETNESVLITFTMYPTGAQDESNQRDYAINMIENTYITEDYTDGVTNNTNNRK
jgi:hypothetical protein